MIRLVMIWDSGDGCTYSCENVKPFYYESAEAALVDLEATIRAQVNQADKVLRWQDVWFAGIKMDPFDFMHDGTFYPPAILTVDEWFEQHASGG